MNTSESINFPEGSAAALKIKEGDRVELTENYIKKIQENEDLSNITHPEGWWTVVEIYYDSAYGPYEYKLSSFEWTLDNIPYRWGDILENIVNEEEISQNYENETE